jgi:outer membrane protein OmpA-like peptidoglycan-associated protein
MNSIKNLYMILAVVLLTACCPTGTTVVLVPDPGGKVGKVEVVTRGGMTTLSEANHSSQAANSNQKPSQATQLSDEKIKDMFAETLAKEPMPPEHFLFHFATGKADILPEDSANLAKAKSAIQVRKSCDISVIGHSDTVGDNEMNKGLSMNRANSVASALIGLGAAKECMADLRYYGESDPAVPTADDVDEPRNRRVEVEIR